MRTVERGARHRARLLEGMAAALARKGYEAVTIADVVAGAGVSKRTFYEHFDSKESCLLAAHAHVAGRMLAALRQRLAAGPEPGGSAIGVLVDGYLDFLERTPQPARTLLFEVARVGATGRRGHRQTTLELARLIRDSFGDEFAPEPLDLDQSIALVGGLTELVRTQAEDDPGRPLRTLRPAMLRFAEAVTGRSRDRVGS